MHYYQKSLSFASSNYYARSNIIDIEIELRQLNVSRKHLGELRSLELDENITAAADEFSGRIALIEGKPKVAAKYFRKAIRQFHETGLALEIGEFALLGEAHLAGGDLKAALKATSHAVKRHRELNFPGLDDHPSQNIWWRHAQALRANKKNKEADEALEMAYDFLLKGIASLRDDGVRRNYLNKVRMNREILRAWQKYAAKRKLPKERRLAHLEVESSLREPFERLAEVSLELNALHTVEEIQTFLVEEATELSGGERVMLILEKRSDDFSRPTNKAAETTTTREVVESILPLPSYAPGKGYEKAEDPKDVLKRIGKYLDQAHLTRTVQLIQPSKSISTAKPAKSAKKTKKNLGGLSALSGSRIIAPLIAQNQVLGYLYTDMDFLYGTFDDTDRDMLGMLANQGAVALDNAGLVEGLEQKVEERTEELNARVDELAIINSVQAALASKLDIQEIVNSVGDKLAEIFSVENVGIGFLDKASGMMKVPYLFENGKRIENLEFPISEWSSG